MSPFLAWVDFHARSRFARTTIPEEKWGTTRSLQETSPELGIQKVQRYFEMIIALSTLLVYIDLRMMSKFYGSS